MRTTVLGLLRPTGRLGQQRRRPTTSRQIPRPAVGCGLLCCAATFARPAQAIVVCYATAPSESDPSSEDNEMPGENRQQSCFPAVIVAYHGGGDMLNELRNRGLPFVRIQTSPDVSANKYMLQYLAKGAPDQHVLTFSGNVDKLSAQLADLGVTHIIPADEAGVELTDLLCASLDLPFNGMNKSTARRDKKLMHEAVSEQGLGIPWQLLCETADEISAWMTHRKLPFPIVVKPLDGAGSAGVSRCDSFSDIEAALSLIRQLALNDDNVITIRPQVLAQELLRGIEYIVDTVSLAGHHKVTDIWQCKKGAHNGSAFVYEYFDLIPCDGTLRNALETYIGGVLDALDITLGPGHAEVYFHEQTGPILIEVGSRIGGPRMPFATAACTASGKSQMEYTVDAYLEPQKFHDNWDSGYELVSRARMVFLISNQEARLKELDPDLVQQIRSLPSYYAEELAVEPGDKLQKTIDVRSSPGCIFLVHDSAEQLAKDYDIIRKLELGLYVEV